MDGFRAKSFQLERYEACRAGTKCQCARSRREIKLLAIQNFRAFRRKTLDRNVLGDIFIGIVQENENGFRRIGEPRPQKTSAGIRDRYRRFALQMVGGILSCLADAANRRIHLVELLAFWNVRTSLDQQIVNLGVRDEMPYGAICLGIARPLRLYAMRCPA